MPSAPAAAAVVAVRPKRAGFTAPKKSKGVLSCCAARSASPEPIREDVPTSHLEVIEKLKTTAGHELLAQEDIDHGKALSPAVVSLPW